MIINRLAKGFIVIASLALGSTSFVQASQAKENDEIDTNATETSVPIVYTVDSQFTPKVELQNKNSATKPVKDAIRAVLNNKAKLFQLVERLAGKKVRNVLEERFTKYIEPVLKDLLDEYYAFGWSDVQNKLYNSLKKSGLSNINAKVLAYWTTIAIKSF